MRYSNCCRAEPYEDKTHDDLGRCSECMDYAVFEGEDEE